MKYYQRIVTRRAPVNRFGRLGYVEYRETVKTNNIDSFNYRKQIKFTETEDRDIIRELRKADRDTVYETRLETLSRTWGKR